MIGCQAASLARPRHSARGQSDQDPARVGPAPRALTPKHRPDGRLRLAPPRRPGGGIGSQRTRRGAGGRQRRRSGAGAALPSASPLEGARAGPDGAASGQRDPDHAAPSLLTLLPVAGLQVESVSFRLDDLYRHFLYTGLHELSFIIINSRSPQSVLLAEDLRERVSQVPIYQETEEEPVWDILEGGKDDVFVYDRCGRLSFYIPLPLSVLSKQYVAAAVLSAYFTDPCGICDATMDANEVEGVNSTSVQLDGEEWDENEANGTLDEAHNITTPKPLRKRPHHGHHPHRHHHPHGNHSHPHLHGKHHHHKNHSHEHHHHGNHSHVHTHYSHEHTHQGHEQTHQGHEHTHQGHEHTHQGHEHTHQGHEQTHQGHEHTHQGHEHTHQGHEQTHQGHEHTHQGHEHTHQGHEHTHQGHEHTHHSHNHGNYSHHPTNQTELDPNRLEVFLENETNLLVEPEAEAVTTSKPSTTVRILETLPGYHSREKQKTTRRPNRPTRRVRGDGKLTPRRGRGERNRTRDAPESRVRRSHGECHVLVNTTRCRDFLPKFHIAKQCCRVGANNRITRVKSQKCVALNHAKCAKILKLKDCCRRYHPNRSHGRQSVRQQNVVTPTPTRLSYCTGFTPSACLTIYRLGFTRSDCCSEDELHTNSMPLLSPEMCHHFDNELCGQLRHNGLHHRCCENRTPKENLQTVSE